MNKEKRNPEKRELSSDVKHFLWIVRDKLDLLSKNFLNSDEIKLEYSELLGAGYILKDISKDIDNLINEELS